VAHSYSNSLGFGDVKMLWKFEGYHSQQNYLLHVPAFEKLAKPHTIAAASTAAASSSKVLFHHIVTSQSQDHGW